MDRLLDLILFVYFKYTVHLIPKDLRSNINLAVEDITRVDLVAAEAVERAKMKAKSASRQRKPLLVDQDGQSITAEKDSTEPF